MILEKKKEIPASEAETVKELMGAEFDAVKDDIENGRATLLYLPETESYLCLRQDNKTLVCVYMYGKNCNVAADLAVKTARANNMEEVIFHTPRQGLARLMSKHGLEHVGTYHVYRCEL